MHQLQRSRIRRLHPVHQQVFAVFGIDFFEQATEGSLAGPITLARPSPTGPTAQAASLGVIETPSKFSNRVRSFAASGHGQSDDG